MATTIPARLPSALPFWLSLALLPLALAGMVWGGAWGLTMPLFAWYLVSGLDALLGESAANPPTEAPDRALFWHRAITMVWVPLQLAMIFCAIWAASLPGHLTGWEKVALFFGIGVASGTIGIVYGHELIHQRERSERFLGDVLLASTLYSHFRSEHMLVHHSWVGTPRDSVSARYNENFYRFFWRVLRDGPASAWRTESGRLVRTGRSRFDRRNPFWTYAALQAAMLLTAYLIGDWQGIAFFVFQALVAIWQLELVNYVEHYGLTRKHLGDGRYEHIKPRHSWNASHTASNWLLINLQRHSDHHVKPDRRFPLLQTYSEDDAPQLPLGYPLMTLVALVPSQWRRRMNPRVRAWRRQFYPEIEEWGPYTRGETPMPRGGS